MRSAKLMLVTVLAANAMVCLLPLKTATAETPIQDMISDKVVFAVQLDRPATALPPTLVRPLLERAGLPDKQVEATLRVLGKLPGPLLVCGVNETQSLDDAPTIQVMAEYTASPTTLNKLLDDDIVPLMNELFGGKTGGHAGAKADGGDASGKRGGPFSHEGSGDRHKLLADGEPIFVLAIKDKRLFGSSDPRHVNEWLKGEYPQRKWVADSSVRKWIGSLDKKPRIRLYVNSARISEALTQEATSRGEKMLVKLLAPEQLRAVGGDLTWDKRGLMLDLSAALHVDEEKGAGLIASVLTATPTQSLALNTLSPEYCGVVRLAFPSVDGVTAAIYRMTDRIDKEISAEYREELADFEKETGVTFDTQIAANLAGELVIAARPDFTKPVPVNWTALVPIADEPVFRSAFEKLLRHFGIASSQNESGINTVASPYIVPMAYVVRSGYLVMGDSVATVAATAAALDDKGDKPANPMLAECLEIVGASHTMSVMVDVKTLKKQLGPMAKMLSRFAGVLRDGSIGVCLTRVKDAPHLKLIWAIEAAPVKPGESDEADGEGVAIETLVQVLGAGVDGLFRARAQAQRVVMMSNLRNIGVGLNVHASAHGGVFTDDPAELVRNNTVPLDNFRSVYENEPIQSVDELRDRNAFILRSGLTQNTPPNQILAAQRVSDGEGASFLFIDGHVEYIMEPRASEIIAEILSGAESVTRN